MTSKELAKILGVSQSTISRSLNNSPKISESTKTRVLEAAETYHLVLNDSAKKLKSKNANMIGIIMPNLFVDFYNSMSSGDLFNKLKLHFSKHNLDVISFTFTNDSLNTEIKQLVLSGKIDGFIVIRQLFNDEIKQFLYQQNIPFVLINQANLHNQLDHCVSVDFYGAGFLVGNYFKEQNYKNVLCLSSEMYALTNELKIAGFIDGLETTMEDFKNNIYYSDLSFEGGKNFALTHLKLLRETSAIFTVDDMMAIGIMNICGNQQIHVPSQLSIVGFDGLPIGDWVYPSLSSVSINHDRLCEYAVTELVSLLAHKKSLPENTLIKGELLLKQSTRNNLELSYHKIL